MQHPPRVARLDQPSTIVTDGRSITIQPQQQQQQQDAENAEKRQASPSIDSFWQGLVADQTAAGKALKDKKPPTEIWGSSPNSNISALSFEETQSDMAEIKANNTELTDKSTEEEEEKTAREADNTDNTELTEEKLQTEKSPEGVFDWWYSRLQIETSQSIPGRL